MEPSLSTWRSDRASLPLSSVPMAMCTVPVCFCWFTMTSGGADCSMGGARQTAACWLVDRESSALCGELNFNAAPETWKMNEVITSKILHVRKSSRQGTNTYGGCKLFITSQSGWRRITEANVLHFNVLKAEMQNRFFCIKKKSDSCMKASNSRLPFEFFVPHILLH